MLNVPLNFCALPPRIGCAAPTDAALRSKNAFDRAAVLDLRDADRRVGGAERGGGLRAVLRGRDRRPGSLAEREYDRGIGRRVEEPWRRP